jgi:Ca2+-binding EF-hand superfamily protein
MSIKNRYAWELPMKSILGICSGLVVLVAASVAIGQDREPQEPGQDAPRERRPDGDRERRERRPDMMMVLLDTDRDGALSADEINAAPDALRALDKDNDGIVSGEELRPRRPDRDRERGDRPEGGEGRRGMGGFIMRLDSNQDGVVTREEYAAGQDEQFNRMDKNQDGQIDAEEAASGFGGRGGRDGRDGRGDREGGEPRERRPRQP